MGQGLQIIRDDRKKTSHVTDTEIFLPDKPNTLAAR
jgi:hypothetical protein